VIEFVPPGETEPVSYQAPPLNNVFQRWDEEVIRFTIERGRPGTPMPAWGVQYGGSMTTQMVDDVITWLKTLEGNQNGPPELAKDATGQEIFEARCALCHGDNASGKEDVLWHQGMALWKGDVKHLTEQQHLATIRNGRRFAFMPPFAEAPSQGVPVPTYPLTDEQIEAVMAYERTL
jgi:mono/diheme cytochrome c family protein